MPIETIYNTPDELAEIKPDFISVTYGAGGSENCATTLEIASTIKNSPILMVSTSHTEPLVCYEIMLGA